MDYDKPWLSIEGQIDGLVSRGVRIDDTSRAVGLLSSVGYYRLSGYLYPFRESERFADANGRECVRLLSRYRSGTNIDSARRLLNFDRTLRLCVLEGVERIEVALRTRLGYELGRLSVFAHEDSSMFTSAFTERRSNERSERQPSRHDVWLARVSERQRRSDEAFVAHFRYKYEDRMPIWALTEFLELGHVSRLYAGLRNDVATEIAHTFNVPTKRLMESWIATVNYVRNVSAHHARLFNRKLVTAPKRPPAAAVPLLAHLSRDEAPKQFGTYNALAIMAYLLRSIDDACDWPRRVGALLQSFPANEYIDAGSMGIAPGWLEEALWAGDGSPALEEVAL